MRKYILLVTGLSGAGKTEVLKTLEDVGYECVDNLPLRLVSALLSDVDALPERLALGIDSRNGCDDFKQAVEMIRRHDSIDSHLLYLEAEADELVRRYKETRRSHPLSVSRPLSDTVAQEALTSGWIKEFADDVLDTTDFVPRVLRNWVLDRFDAPEEASTKIFISSFGFKYGLPREADIVFDVRYLKNPYWDEGLRHKTGLEEDVQAYVKSDAVYDESIGKLSGLLSFQLKQLSSSDRAYVTIAVGCTGGKHRSVTVANHLYELLKDGFDVRLNHRELA